MIFKDNKKADNKSSADFSLRCNVRHKLQCLCALFKEGLWSCKQFSFFSNEMTERGICAVIEFVW